MEHRAHLQLAPGSRAPLRLPLPARHGLQLQWCTCQRPTTSTTHCAAALWATRVPGARPRCTSQCLQTELQSCTSGRTSRRRACPTRRQEGWTSTASRSWTRPWRRGGGGHGGFGAAAEARVPRRRGRRRHAGHPGRGAAGAHAHHARQLPGAPTARAPWPASRWEASSWRATP